MDSELKENTVNIFSKSVLVVSIIVALSIPFSFWAVNAKYIGKYDLGLAIVFSGISYLSIITSLIIAAFSLIATFIYKFSNTEGWKNLFYAFLISLFSPILWVIWLDYG
jgi:hypothetical protein